MRVIRNYSENQALELLNDLTSRLGQVYIPDSGIIKHYIYWYIPIVEGYEYLFSKGVLRREVDLDLDKFVLTGNPNVDTNFNLGVDIQSNSIDISGNNLTSLVVDTELTNLVNNFSNFNGTDQVFVNIGGDNDYPLYANNTPSQSVLDSVNTLATTTGLHVSYWDGAKQVSIPNARIEITTNNDYEIQEVNILDSSIISLDEVTENENAFYVSKATFEAFAVLMNGQRYAESSFKVCVVFNDNLTIKEVYSRPEQGTEISLNGYNLAYAPLDFFMQAIVLPSLGNPVMDIWNNFIINNETNQEKIFRVFPEIDLTYL